MLCWIDLREQVLKAVQFLKIVYCFFSCLMQKLKKQYKLVGVERENKEEVVRTLFAPEQEIKVKLAFWYFS